MEWNMGWNTEWSTDSELGVEVISERVAQILGQVDMCVLGTREERGPRLTPCFFAPVKEFGLVMVSSDRSRHMRNLEADPHCSVLMVPDRRTEPGRLVSLHLSGRAVHPRGRRRLAALAAYAARMSGRVASAVGSARDLASKRVIIIEPRCVELMDTSLLRGTARMVRGTSYGIEAA